MKNERINFLRLVVAHKNTKKREQPGTTGVNLLLERLVARSMNASYENPAESAQKIIKRRKG
jgi:hypothetical protein